MTKKGRKRKRRRHRTRQPSRARRRPEVEYPIATMAYYGPDDETITKIAVGIIESEDAEPIMERWYGEGVATDPEVQAQIAGFIEAHGAQSVTMTDGVLGCPHEEGKDDRPFDERGYIRKLRRLVR